MYLTKDWVSKACAARKAFDNSYGIVITCNQASLFPIFFKGEHFFLGGKGEKHEIRGQAKEKRKKDHLVQGFHEEFY